MGTETVQLLEQLLAEGGSQNLFIAGTEGVPVGEPHSFDGGDAEAVIFRNIAITRTCDVFWEYDPDGDGSYEISVQIESFEKTGLSMLNNVPVSSGAGLRVRMENTGDSAAAYIVTGLKTSN